MLENYLAEGAYRFQMQFGRGTLTDFYGPTPEHAEIIAERAKWLESTEGRVLVTLAEGEPLLDETMNLAGLSLEGAYRERARALGKFWEPDYLLLEKRGGEIRLVCGCVCFPSSWSVEEKIGKAIEKIHEVVPGLNPAIGRQIHTFLDRIKPGVSWTRSNWGLSRSPERNQHPSRKLPRLDETVGPEEVFFRVEEQSLAALPETGGILFGIRIKVFPLRAFFGTAAKEKLVEALQTMPPAMADYKGLGRARDRIIDMLNESGGRSFDRD